MSARPLRLLIYRTFTADLWRWRLRATNGKIIDASTEAYTRRAGLDANLLQAHGLDVAGIKPGETVTFERGITSRQVGSALSTTMFQTIKVTVAP